MTDYEMAEAERFAEALEAIEALAEPDLDPREDPTLFSLAALAAEIHDAEQAATNSPGFRSYCERSRTYVLNRLGARRVSEQVTDKASRDDGQPFFIFRWNVLAPIASAAVSAVLVLAFVATQLDSSPPQSASVIEPPAVESAPARRWRCPTHPSSRLLRRRTRWSCRLRAQRKARGRMRRTIRVLARRTTPQALMTSRSRLTRSRRRCRPPWTSVRSSPARRRPTPHG